MNKVKDMSQYSLFVGIVAVIIYNLNYIILGDASYITIGDNLDDLIPTFKMIKDCGAFLYGDAIMPVADGFKRTLFNSPFDPTTWIYMLLPAYWATVVQIFICRIVAFVSMYYLLKESFGDEERTYIPLVVALGFSVVPFYYIHGLGVAGTPLAALSFLCLYRHKKIALSCFWLAVYGVYTYFPLIGVFTCIVAALCFLMVSVREKRVHWHLLLGLVVLSLVYVISNWSLISGFVFGNEVIYHRVEFHTDITIVENFKQVLGYFLQGQMHAGAFVPAFAIATALLFIVISKGKDKSLNCLVLCFVFIGLIAFISNCLKPYIALFNAFQFDRFYFFIPILCFFSFGYVLYRYKLLMHRLVVLSAFALTIFTCLLCDNEHKYAFKKFVGSENIAKELVPYGKFYNDQLFSIIKSDLRFDNNDKACAIGLHPNILMYNEIPSVDFYHNLYPLEYKHKFRKVIAKELEKDSSLQDYFDNWGNRCYMFSSELGRNYLYGKNSEIREVNNLEIDTEALRELGCSYIISAVKINNAEQLDIDYINTYSTPESFWELYVYRL